MLHQDIRPENIMIDKTGTVKIIDFGSTKVTGVSRPRRRRRQRYSGTVQYTAPEYFLGEGGSPRSDQFSLGVIAYQMLTGKLPYGAAGCEGENAITIEEAEIQVRARRQSRDSGMDRRHAAARGASGPGQAL